LCISGLQTQQYPVIAAGLLTAAANQKVKHFWFVSLPMVLFFTTCNNQLR